MWTACLDVVRETCWILSGSLGRGRVSRYWAQASPSTFIVPRAFLPRAHRRRRPSGSVTSGAAPSSRPRLSLELRVASGRVPIGHVWGMRFTVVRTEHRRGYHKFVLTAGRAIQGRRNSVSTSSMDSVSRLLQRGRSMRPSRASHRRIRATFSARLSL